jgi:hypothetical protein
VLFKAQVFQDGIGILAPLRRRRAQLVIVSAQGEGLTDQLDIAQDGTGHGLGHTEVFDLRVVEHLINRINGAAGNAGVVALDGFRQFPG